MQVWTFCRWMVCNFSSHFGFTTLEVNPMAQAQGQTWIWATQELGRGQLQDRGARRWLARSKVKEKEEEEQTCSKQHLSRTCGPAKGLCMGTEKGAPPNKVLQKGLYLDLVLELGLAKRAHWVLQKGSHPNLPTVSPGQKGRKNANERNEMQEHHMKSYEIIWNHMISYEKRLHHMITKMHHMMQKKHHMTSLKSYDIIWFHMISSDVLPFFGLSNFQNKIQKKQNTNPKKPWKNSKKSLGQKGSLGASISVPAICFGSRF